MQKNKFNCLLVSLFILFSALLNAQEKSSLQKEFEEFAKKETASFVEFKDKRDKEFADLLKKRWTSFEENDKKIIPVIPLPPIQPVIIPPAPTQEHIEVLPVIDIPPYLFPITDSLASKNNLPPTVNLNKSSVISFFNVEMPIFYEEAFLIHLSTVDEAGVSAYWNKMSKTNYPDLIKQINEISKKMQLNDWGVYELTKKIGENLFVDENEIVLFNFYLLVHLDYDAKIAKRNNELILLLPFDYTIYQKKYININDKQYYIMSDRNSNRGLIYTFKQQFSTTSKNLNLDLSKPLKIGNNYTDKKLFIKKIDSTVNITFNKNLIEFYNKFPQTDLSVFFSARIDPATSASFYNALAPIVKGKNELDAVNIILDFVQSSFEYKTDDSQFGYEKYYFPEDMLNYPFSDCEDRSILFAHLVKSILKLEVIGLEYKTHVACAVKFNNLINGDGIEYKEQKYIICDPTYIGASAGMTMPQFKEEKPSVVEIK